MNREVDRLLAGLAHFNGQSAHEHRPAATAASTTNRPKHYVSGSRPAVTASPADRLALWSRVLLGVLLGAAVTQWPYPHGCGWPLAGYLGAVAMIVMAGAWVGVVSWNVRAAAAHVLGLIILLWGLVLVATQVLPRIGYAAVHASWGC